MTGLLDTMFVLGLDQRFVGQRPRWSDVCARTEPDLAWAQVQNKLQLATASLPLHHFRQARHGELELVLHLGPGEVRIGPRGKGQFNAAKNRTNRWSRTGTASCRSPVIFCSMICVTLFSTVSADAPG